MTKVATMDTRRFVTMLLLAAMMIAMIPIGLVVLPSGVLAAENTSVQGSFQVQSGNFTVVGVEVWPAVGGSEVSSVTPTNEYLVKVEVLNANGLNTLDNVTVVLFYESDGEITTDNAMASDHPQTQATLKWTPGQFELVGPTSTTWSCNNTISLPPDSLAVTQDIFAFHVKIGEVATHTTNLAKWFAYATATDPNETVGIFGSALGMQWYGSISASGTPSWTSLVPNTDYGTAKTVSVTYTSNGVYTKSARALGEWTRNTEGTNATLVDGDTLIANQFSLKVDDQAANPDLAVRLSTDYKSIGGDTQTVEGGVENASTGIWLRLGEPFLQGLYTGTIYFQISNP